MPLAPIAFAFLSTLQRHQLYKFEKLMLASDHEQQCLHNLFQGTDVNFGCAATALSEQCICSDICCYYASECGKQDHNARIVSCCFPNRHLYLHMYDGMHQRLPLYAEIGKISRFFQTSRRSAGANAVIVLYSPGKCTAQIF